MLNRKQEMPNWMLQSSIYFFRSGSDVVAFSTVLSQIHTLSVAYAEKMPLNSSFTKKKNHKGQLLASLNLLSSTEIPWMFFRSFCFLCSTASDEYKLSLTVSEFSSLVKGIS